MRQTPSAMENLVKPRNIVRAIETQRAKLRKSERKVADYVLAQPNEVIHMRIVDLAQEAHVSEPTVVRFCRAIGLDGFQSFKLALAQHVANSPQYQEFHFSDQDSAHEYTFKVFDATMESLKRVRDSVDVGAIEQAVAGLTQARRVAFFGFGASSAVASDAQHKFFRLDIPSGAYADPHLQTMAAMSLKAEDVVVAISQSGRTQALLDALTLVRANGTQVIVIAPPGTPVCDQADVAIYVDVEENTRDHTPLPSRIAQMAIIDILAVGVSRSKGPAVRAHLQSLERGLQTLRQNEPS